ncbi:MAG: PKD domain-containing protein [Flavobacteriales bacterium]
MTPTMVGSFCVGVRVRDFRNGVLLSEVVRDFRFDVTACTVNVHAVIARQSGSSDCAGTALQLHNNSIGAHAYHWDFGVSGLDSDTSNAAEPFFVYPDTGVYTVTLIVNPGWPCADTATNEVRLFDSVDVHFTPPDIRCPDQFPVTLVPEGDLTASTTFVWDIAGGSSPDLHARDLSLTLNGLGAHAVHVVVTDHGCTGEYTDSIRVYPFPEPDFSIDPQGCQPYTPGIVNRSRAWTPMTYDWDFGDGTSSQDSVPSHTYVSPGNYSVKLTVSTSNGCIASRSLSRSDAVEVWPMPKARITADPMMTSLMHPEVTFADHSIGAVAIDIDVAGTHYTTPQVTHVFDDAGRFPVLLTATSDMGCVDTASVTVIVGDHFFYAPTAFTPNGDADNEVWLPSVRGARLYRLEVFDRWGQVRFSTTDPRQGWDGKGATPGVYAYKAWLSEYGPLEKEYNGSFILLR